MDSFIEELKKRERNNRKLVKLIISQLTKRLKDKKTQFTIVDLEYNRPVFSTPDPTGSMLNCTPGPDVFMSVKIQINKKRKI